MADWCEGASGGLARKMPVDWGGIVDGVGFLSSCFGCLSATWCQCGFLAQVYVIVNLLFWPDVDQESAKMDDILAFR